MKFTYRWGERPLDGFTLKRGLGRGGFGEVYFALSDGGKEVALKLIRGHNDTELRGISTCLNLKHPHLVHLYDLRTDAHGECWLVMEYVQGETLANLLQRSPKGLPEAQARDWFLQTARAVAYLHDRGVIHRDIKPANLFIENGLAKLGDYGLSKSLEISQHGQSTNVGTIHYMAPEVAGGNYTRQIDVYACGVMLYEMLTGGVPFQGGTWAEVAIRHQTELPDFKRAPAAYVPILQKALDKQADKRFVNMDEMIAAVERVGAPVPMPLPTMPSRLPQSKTTPLPTPVEPPRSTDTRDLINSMLLCALVAVPAAAGWAAFAGRVNWAQIGDVYALTVAMGWLVLACVRVLARTESKQARRLFMAVGGAAVGCLAFWLDGWNFPQLWMQDEALPAGTVSYWGGAFRGEPYAMEMLAGYSLFFAAMLALPRWWLYAEPRRQERFSFFPPFAIWIWAIIFAGMWKNFSEHARPLGQNHLTYALVAAAVVVQLAATHRPRPRTNRSFRRRLSEGGGV